MERKVKVRVIRALEVDDGYGNRRVYKTALHAADAITCAILVRADAAYRKKTGQYRQMTADEADARGERAYRRVLKVVTRMMEE